MKLYVNHVATTSRAVLALIEEAAIGCDIETIDLMSGQHRQQAFLSINPNGLIPVLEDEDFVLTESSAILRYLATKHGSPMYPTDLRQRARVDEFMAWFEANFYKDFGYQFVYPQLFPHHSRGSDDANGATVAFGRNQARDRLAVLDTHMIGDDRMFLVGDGLTIADFHGASILSLGELVGCSLDAYPNVKRWYGNITSLPSWTAINQAFQGFASSLRDQQFVGLS